MGPNRTEPIRTETLVAPPGSPALLTIAVRAYPDGVDRDPRLLKSWRRPGAMLVFDTETRIDPTQRLTFGSFQFIDDGERLSESLFYGNDLPKKDRRTLERYILHDTEGNLLALMSEVPNAA